MPESQAQVDITQALKDAGPYPLEAYHFVRDGLGYTVNRFHAEAEALSPDERHVSGQQLCLGLRDFAIEQYGMMAPVVLRQWKITRTDDFGRMVFAMITAGLMSKTSEDSVDDFKAVYDFEEAFGRSELLARIGRS